MKWPEPDLNRRHKDFQSSALPTELPSHNHADKIDDFGFYLQADLVYPSEKLHFAGKP